MSRRKILLLASVFSAIAIGLGFVAPDYLPSKAPMLMAEVHACLETRGEEPAGELVNADCEQRIAITWHAIRFDLARTRRSLFTDFAKGVVKDIGRLETPLERLEREGALKFPKITTFSGHSYVISSLPLPFHLSGDGAHLFGEHAIVAESSATIRKDGRVHLRMKIILAKPGDVVAMSWAPFGNHQEHHFANATAGMTQRDASIVVKVGQMCFLGGVRRKNIDSDDLVLPGLGAWLTFPRAVEIDEEVLIVATPTLVSYTEE